MQNPVIIEEAIAEEPVLEEPNVEKAVVGQDTIEQPKKRKKGKKLTKEEKRERDRLRKREQSRRRQQKEQEKLGLCEKTLEASKKTAQWQQQKVDEEDQLLKKYEIDMCNPRELNPALAGYDVYENVYRDPALTSPVFLSMSIQRINERIPHLFAQQKWATAERINPTFIGVTGFQVSPELTSPIFRGIYFKKRTKTLEEEELSDEEDGVAKKEATITAKVTISANDIENLRRGRYSTECIVCTSTEAPGCPGCWMIPDGFFPEKEIPSDTNLVVETPDAPIVKQLLHRNNRLDLVCTPSSAPKMFADIPFSPFEVEEDSDDYDSGEELQYHRECIRDIRELKKYRAKRVYLDILIKAVPAGSALSLRIDREAEIKYLYDLFRMNFDDSHRTTYIILPTSIGYFVLDETIVAPTELTLGQINGKFTLADYNLVPRPKQPIALLSVCTIHPSRTPTMLDYYLRHNFHLLRPRESIMRYVAHSVPEDLSRDEVQVMMAREVKNLIHSALQNKLLSKEYKQNKRNRVLQELYEKKMREFKDDRHRNREEPRTKREQKAWVYLNVSIEENNDYRRLSNLWECFQKFEELKLLRNGKLLDAASSKYTRELLTQHSKHTVETFQSVMGTNGTRFQYPVIHLGSGKLVLNVGRRIGLKEKEDKEYGLEMDLKAFADENHEVSIDPREIEWTDKQVTETMVGMSDLVLRPFYTFPWHMLVDAYKAAEVHFTFHSRQLEEYNNLASVFRSEEILNTREITKWITRLETFRQTLNPTGIISQACRRLHSHRTSLRSRYKRQEAVQKKLKEETEARIGALLKEYAHLNQVTENSNRKSASELKKEFMSMNEKEREKMEKKGEFDRKVTAFRGSIAKSIRRKTVALDKAKKAVKKGLESFELE